MAQNGRNHDARRSFSNEHDRGFFTHSRVVTTTHVVHSPTQKKSINKQHYCRNHDARRSFSNS